MIHNVLDWIYVSAMFNSCKFETETKDAWSMISARVKPKNKIGLYCFSTKHVALRSSSKYWLACNQENMSQWSGMSTHRLLFQWPSTIKIQLSTLV